MHNVNSDSICFAIVYRLSAAIFIVCALLVATIPASAQDAEPPQTRVTVNIAGHSAPIRSIVFSSDSQSVMTAGMDKVVNVWSIDRPELGGSPVIRWQRPLRREIARGRGGIIYSIASHPRRSELVLGGYGARRRGDLTFFNPQTEQFLRTEYETHLSPISGLAYSSAGTRLASIDLSGEAYLWPSQGGGPRQIGARESAQPPQHRPITVVAESLVVMPARAGTGEWSLSAYQIASGNSYRLNQVHELEVTALAACKNGQIFASADRSGRVYIWRIGSRTPIQTLQVDGKGSRYALSLAFDPSGSKLAIGTSLPASSNAKLRLVDSAGVHSGGTAELQIWSIPGGQLLQRETVDNNVYGCAISPDGQYLAYGSDRFNRFFVQRLGEAWRPTASPGAAQIKHVQFARTKDEPWLRFSLSSVPSGEQWKKVDIAGTELNVTDARPAAMKNSSVLGSWAYRVELDDNRSPTNRILIYKNRQYQGSIKLDARRQGRIQCQCWIPGANGEPIAFAVGTDLTNEIYIYGLPSNRREAPIVRVFSGHQALVNSVDASSDGIRLASGGDDGTLCFWSLDGLVDAPVTRRWGIGLRQAGGRLVVHSVNLQGPLYQKGVRNGHSVYKIGWPTGDGGAVVKEDASDILRQLEFLPWDKTVYFWTRDAQGKEKDVFALKGSWFRSAGIFVHDSINNQEQWIAWTPAGYYDCSLGGERLLGWIVNQPTSGVPVGKGRKPDFFVAEQVHQRLYRPAVLKSVLQGNVAAGLQVSTGESVAIFQPPRVEIVSPTERVLVVKKPRLDITARAIAVGQHKVKEMRCQISGIDRRSAGGDALKGVNVARRNEPTENRTWTVNLEPGLNEIRVIASTDVSEGYSEPILVTYDAEITKPKLYAVAVGVSDYRESGFEQLDYAHLDAAGVTDILKSRSQKLYDPGEIGYIPQHEATKERILQALRSLESKMKPRDVGVFFFSGHGAEDQNGVRYLIPIDGRQDDLKRTCISQDELTEFTKQTDGILVLMIDACHSQGIGLDGLTLLLQRGSSSGKGVNIFCSSQSDQASVELDSLRAGVFAHAIQKGLDGEAGRYPTLSELNTFVTREVLALTNKGQYPVAFTGTGALQLTTKP